MELYMKNSLAIFVNINTFPEKGPTKNKKT